MAFKTIEWTGRTVKLLDQTLLPLKKKYLTIRDEKAMWEAIKMLRVRGAPAIGVAAAFGLYVGVAARRPQSVTHLKRDARKISKYLATSRPTAVNLFWALDRCMALVESFDHKADIVSDCLARLLNEAIAIQEEDIATCDAIGRHGAEELAGVEGILTHCNTGALATAGAGTALSVIFQLSKANPSLQVYADETRPLLQGSRLTAWELKESGVPVKVITDSSAATVLQRGMVQAVIVGADRIAANGDAANKIGTMPLAIAANYYKIPFYVAAPLSTFDLSLKSGEEIPIEERGADEVTRFGGVQVAPKGVDVYAPAFDVTPNKLIAGIVTEFGVLKKPYRSAIKKIGG